MRAAATRLAAVAVLLWPGSGCAPAPGSRPEASSRRTLKVVLLPYASFAPLIVAKERGFFARHGIDVEWVNLERSAEALPSLSQGRLDVVPGGLSAGLVNMISAGAPIRLVANKGLIPAEGCTGAIALVGRKGLGPFPDSLRRAKVSVQPMLFTELFLDRLLEQNGLARDAITRVDLPKPAVLEGLSKGLVDFAVTSEPLVSQGRKDGSLGVIVEAGKVLPDFDHAFLLFGPNLLKTDPEAGRRFLMGYVEGVQAYREGKTTENVAVLAKAMHLEPDALRETCWMPVRADLGIDTPSVKEFVDWTRQRGLLEGNPKVEQMIDLGPLAAAKAALAAQGASR